MSDAARELSEFLATRRAKITPEQVGLPSYGQRRVLGLFGMSTMRSDLVGRRINVLGNINLVEPAPSTRRNGKSSKLMSMHRKSTSFVTRSLQNNAIKHY